MKIAIMQPYFMPYIGYFQLINVADKFVILDDVNYIKKGWINRNNILINKKSYLFVLPLQKVSQNKNINEIKILDSYKWKSDLLKTISESYKKAPFYSDVYPLIEKIINYDQNNLVSYIKYSIVEICNYLKINTEILISSEIEKNNELKGEKKIVDICSLLNSKTYINPIGGIELYNRSYFSKYNLKLQFLKTDNLVYEQFKNEFIPWLSIIDVIMFNSIDDTQKMLTKFELV